MVVTSGLGLRERKKLATRQALHEAALHLAMADGFDRLTVEAIADAANVSRRTFSNYFANKEEALLYGDQARVWRVLETTRARPRSETAWTALTGAAREMFAELPDSHDRDWVARATFIRSEPTLLQQQMATYSSFERELAEEVEARLPARERTSTKARLIAGCFLTTLRVATTVWLDQPQGASLAELAEQALAEASAHFPT